MMSVSVLKVNGDAFQITVEQAQCILEVKQKIASVEGCAVSQQNLYVPSLEAALTNSTAVKNVFPPDTVEEERCFFLVLGSGTVWALTGADGEQKEVHCEIFGVKTMREFTPHYIDLLRAIYEKYAPDRIDEKVTGLDASWGEPTRAQARKCYKAAIKVR
jgi:hypothetical protein